MVASAPLRRRLRALVDDALLYRGTPPEVEAWIGERARAETFRITRPLMLAACFVGLAWWPFDALLYRDEPRVVHAFAEWRSAVVVYSLVYYFTCERWASLRRHWVAWGTLLGGIITFVVGAALGAVGSLDRPWFASLYFAPIISFPFLMRPRPRLAATIVIALAGLAGFFGAHPANLAHRDLGTAAGLMAFSVAIAACAGHATYHLFRVGVLRARALAERTAELEVLSRSLADRVAERTAELRLLAAHVEELREVERGAIARELHDELGQLLTGMRTELDMAERLRERGAPPGDEHARLVELLDATLASTRSMLSHLRPRILDDLGLVAALEWLVSDLRRRSGLAVRFRAEPDDFWLPGEVATGVFRVVQESLTNVQRHARARAVEVEVRLDGDAVMATVTDDGVGLPPPDTRRPSSLGLLGMRERAAALGGTFEISAMDGGGTRVTVRFPAPREPPVLQ